MQANLGLGLSPGLPQLVVVVIFADAIYPTMTCFTITRTAFIFPVTCCSLCDHGMHAQSLKLPHSASADVMSRTRRDRQSWRCHRTERTGLPYTALPMAKTCRALHCCHLLSCSVASLSLSRHKQKDWVFSAPCTSVFLCFWAGHWVYLFRRQCNFFSNTSPKQLMVCLAVKPSFADFFLCGGLIYLWTERYLLEPDIKFSRCADLFFPSRCWNWKCNPSCNQDLQLSGAIPPLLIYTLYQQSMVDVSNLHSRVKISGTNCYLPLHMVHELYFWPNCKQLHLRS
jgi:hypothetical protein